MTRRWFAWSIVYLGLTACNSPSRPHAESPRDGASQSSQSAEPAEPPPVPPPSEPPSPEQTKSFAKSSNEFGFALYKTLPKPGNLAFSPASTAFALTMTWAGARGDTAAEMQKTLHLTAASENVLESTGNLARALQDPKQPLTLRIANQLFAEKTLALEPAYVERVKSSFAAPVGREDFKRAPEPARNHINAWVEAQTRKRIKQLVPPGGIDDMTRLVLVNAIYFLGDWLEPFKKESTYPEVFTVQPGKPKQVPMMHLSHGFRVAKADGASVLELPYKGNQMDMLIVLPDAASGLDALEKGLTVKQLERWNQALAAQAVNVTLPKFEINPSEPLKLGSALGALGMKTAFDRQKADFTGIANPKDPRDKLYIGEVFHKAFVKLDEKGTEAAAATAVVMKGAGAAPGPEPIEFKADHPFLFVLRDRSSGFVLFMGRVTDPV